MGDFIIVFPNSDSEKIQDDVGYDAEFVTFKDAFDVFDKILGEKPHFLRKN